MYWKSPNLSSRKRERVGEECPPRPPTSNKKRPEHDWNEGWRWRLGWFQAGQYKRKRKGREGRRVDHTARSDHSGHDLPHTEVRVHRAATSKRNKGSEEDGGRRRWGKEGEKKIDGVSHSRVWFLEREALVFSWPI